MVRRSLLIQKAQLSKKVFVVDVSLSRDIRKMEIKKEGLKVADINVQSLVLT